MNATLKRLDLGENDLTFTRGETFNKWLGTLTQLETLTYEKTNFINFEGIPTEIGNMKNLGRYVANGVRYVGDLNPAVFPSDMTQLSKFIYHHIAV